MTTPPAVGQILKWGGGAWVPANDETGSGIDNSPRYNAGAGLSLNGPTFSAQNTAAMWNANKIASRNIATTLPTTGQVLKWNGTEWTPADDNVATNTPSSTSPPAPKPSALYFNQTNDVLMDNPNINTAPIPGLDNQVFTLAQSSRIVYHTVVEAIIGASGLSVKNTAVVLEVLILNASNEVVSRSTSSGWLMNDVYQNINSTGIGILPAGTYHTKVSMIRPQGGTTLLLLLPGSPSFKTYTSQGSQIIIQLFPD